MRRKEGYAAAERKVLHKNISLCSVEAGEVLGDVETIMGMETHLQTVTSIAPTEVYYLTAKNYERLITKKNPATVDVLREQVIRKLKSRVHTKLGNQIPLLKHVLFKLTDELKPVEKRMPPLRTSKELPERNTLFNHLLSVFVQNKAQLIEPHVPGAIYYREMMREKARIRDNVRRHTKVPKQGVMLRRSLKQTQRPRTIVALRSDLQRQIAQQQELENKWLLEELRAEERLQLQQEFQRLRPLPDINETQEEKGVGDGVQEEPKRLSTAEKLAAERLAAAEANGETAKQYGVFEMPMIRDRHSISHDPPPRLAPKAPQFREESPVIEAPNSDVQSETDAIIGDVMAGNRLQVGSSMDMLETISNPEGRVTRPEVTSRRGAESAHALYIAPEGAGTEGGVLVTELGRPTLPLTFHSYQGGLNHLGQSKESLNSVTSSQGPTIKFVSPLVRSKLNVNYENPEYRDWETSEKTLSFLEERIRNFAVSPTARQALKPVQPPRLARFEKGVSL